MKSLKLLTFCSLYLLSAVWIYAQGSLAPGAAPGASMRSLDQLDPRTPISTAGTVISVPGSYYLTTNLTASVHGIRITTNWVTVDLNGFAIKGDRGSYDYGIYIDGATNNFRYGIRIHNGSIRNFGRGLQVKYAQACRFFNLGISSNEYGAYFDGSYAKCDGNTISDSAISGNEYYGGIYFDAYAGQCNGNRIVDCVVNDNGQVTFGYHGICFYGSVGSRDGNMIARCTVNGNAPYGISIYAGDGTGNGNMIIDCSLVGNAARGIDGGAAAGQFNGNVISRCTVSRNGSDSSGYGVYLFGNSSWGCGGNVISHSTLRDNFGRGIHLEQNYGCRVEGNHLTDNGAEGVYSNNGTNNFIFCNTTRGGSASYSISPNDTWGPIVTAPGVLVTTNGATALSPWANFSR